MHRAQGARHNAQCTMNSAFCIGHCAFLVALCGVAVQTGGCGPKSETIPSTSSAQTRSTATPVDRHALRPVAVPDPSGTAASVQKQLRERESLLTARMRNPGATDAELATEYGEMGKLLMAAEYDDAAEPCFLNAQALQPGDARWPYYLGHLYGRRAQSAQSAAAFERALQLKPTDVPTLVRLGGIYLDQGRPSAAEPLFAKAVSLQPRLGSASLGLGRAALARQDYGQAVEHLEHVLSVEPQASVVHYPLAMAYRGLGDFAKAEAHVRLQGRREAGTPDPLMEEIGELIQSAMAYDGRGERALAAGRWAAAADDFRRGMALTPDNPTLRHQLQYHLATALAMSGDVPAAIEQFEDVVKRSPDFARAHYSLGILMASDGRSQQALEHLSAAVRYDPTNLEARLRLAEVLRLVGRPEDSLPDYEEVVRADPRLVEAWLGYAQALVGVKRDAQARERLAEALRINPDQPQLASALAHLTGSPPLLSR
jgi:tetratricopeptide (TPR) repeat protein